VTLVAISAVGVSLGLVGFVTGLRRERPSLQSVFASLNADESVKTQRQPLSWSRHPGRLDHRAANLVASSVRGSRLFDRELGQRLALSNSSLEVLCARVLASAAIGFFLPILASLGAVLVGVGVPLLIPLGAALLFGIAGALIPIVELNSASDRGRRHARRVICSFLDLVVLGLAGGMGIESALLTAAELGENPVSRRLVAELSLCRDSGDPPWEALARLGETLGIEELGELAATAGLAGTEGAKVRATLAARAASIRRHEVANEEAEANAVTERLFIPGAFLLVGFLIFIGYPAFTRIASGF
jgi:tight adherence protein C